MSCGTHVEATMSQKTHAWFEQHMNRSKKTWMGWKKHAWVDKNMNG